MRDSPVTIERAQAIAAPPAYVWSLLSSPEAWSLHPRTFAFDVVAAPETRLRIMMGLNRAGSPIFTTYAVREEVPGQVLCLESADTLPPGMDWLTLSAVPDGSGAMATITARSNLRPLEHLGPLGQLGLKRRVKNYWRTGLEAWVGSLREVAEGRRPWPAAGMPKGLQKAYAPRGRLARPASACGSALISAPVGAVWETLYAPESYRLFDPEHLACAGSVPGTPLRRAGRCSTSSGVTGTAGSRPRLASWRS